MSPDETVSPEPRTIELSVGALAWIALGTLFVAMRVAGVLSIPVGGVELDHLSGAWQAHAGNEDARFIPTAFQGLTAWSFEFTNSELPMRVLALIASATIPLSLYRLRSLLSEAGALLALVVLSFDPVSILLGSTAWGGAFDAAIVLWLLVLARSGPLKDWDLALASFFTATAGAIVVPFVIAVAVVRLLRQEYPSPRQLAISGSGLAAGVAFASFGYGFGWEGITIPPLTALADGFEAARSTHSTGYLAWLYSLPLLATGAAATGYRAYCCARDHEWPSETAALLAWAALGLGWVVASLGANDPVPLAGAALPLAIVLGRELPMSVSAIARADWRYAGWALAGLLVVGFIAEAYVVDWARVGRPGSNDDKLIVAGLTVAALACIGMIASNRRTLPVLFVPAGVVAGLVMIAGASGVAFGGPNEPLPSPISTVQGEELRSIALDIRDEQGGLIVIHTDFREQMTWPFRDSGDIVLATSVGADASIVIWPPSQPAPEGYSLLEGQWSFIEDRPGPDGGFLDYLRWLSNRNSLQNSIVPVTVYLRTTP